MHVVVLGVRRSGLKETIETSVFEGGRLEAIGGRKRGCIRSPRCTLWLEQMEVTMSQKTFSLVAGVLFLLIALGHALRIASGALVVVENISIPMWASWIALVVMGFLAYEGFRFGRKSRSGT